MTTLYLARWVIPVVAPPIANAAIAVDNDIIVSVGDFESLARQFSQANVSDFGNAAIIPGLINAHSHLELTAMRGFLEDVEHDFFAWLKKLTLARLQRMTVDDLYVSAAWGACEAARAGVTSFADASDAASESMKALRDVGLRGIVYKESFGPDRRLAQENLDKLTNAVNELRKLETPLVKCGVSPHAPYTVCGPQLELISRFASAERLPVMMHAAETKMETALLKSGEGPFAEGLKSRGIEWYASGVSTIQHLKRHGVLDTKPLLAHCINVDDQDIETISQTGSSIAHCPKSNAKLRHGVAPFAKFVRAGIAVGLGSDSMASNNTCDLLEESRFALLLARAQDGESNLNSSNVLEAATKNGARAVGLETQIGALEPGMQADFAVVSLGNIHQSPSFDPVDTLVLTSSGRDVLATVVAGKEVFRDGRIKTVDEDALRKRLGEVVRKLST